MNEAFYVQEEECGQTLTLKFDCVACRGDWGEEIV